MELAPERPGAAASRGAPWAGLAAALGLAALIWLGLLAACGTPELSVAEFCELSRRGDLETVRLFQLEPGTAEFEKQLAVVRRLNDELFSNPPAEIAPVAAELAPLLADASADNERVNQLLDQVDAYVAQNCDPPAGDV